YNLGERVKGKRALRTEQLLNELENVRQRVELVQYTGRAQHSRNVELIGLCENAECVLRTQTHARVVSASCTQGVRGNGIHPRRACVRTTSSLRTRSVTPRRASGAVDSIVARIPRAASMLRARIWSRSSRRLRVAVSGRTQ